MFTPIVLKILRKLQNDNIPSASSFLGLKRLDFDKVLTLKRQVVSKFPYTIVAYVIHIYRNKHCESKQKRGLGSSLVDKNNRMQTIQLCYCSVVEMKVCAMYCCDGSCKPWIARSYNVVKYHSDKQKTSRNQTRRILQNISTVV